LLIDLAAHSDMGSRVQPNEQVTSYAALTRSPFCAAAPPRI